MAMTRNIVWALNESKTSAYTWDDDVGDHYWLYDGTPRGIIPQFKYLPTRLQVSTYDSDRPRYTAPPIYGAVLWL